MEMVRFLWRRASRKASACEGGGWAAYRLTKEMVAVPERRRQVVVDDASEGEGA